MDTNTKIRIGCAIFQGLCLIVLMVTWRKMWRYRKETEELLASVSKNNAEVRAMLYGDGDIAVVPRDPTPEMLRAAGWYGASSEDASAIWASMIVACQENLSRRPQKAE